MADQEVKITITGTDALTPVMQKAIDTLGDLSASVQSLNKNLGVMIGDKPKDDANELNTGLINLDATLDLIGKGLDVAKAAFDLFYEALAKSVEEALASEQANARLQGALIATGQYSSEASEAINGYAEALTKSTGANADTVKTMVATGIQLGLNVEQAEKMEQAARQLAAATGQTATEAFSKLQASMNGQTRALGVLVPQVKDLGAAQLKTGQAIDIVLAATTAQYQAYQESLPAALAKSTTAYEDLYKALGLGITASPALRAAIDSMASSMQSLGAFITANKATITDWVNSSILFAINSLQLLQNTIDVLYRTGDAAFNALATVINGAFAGIAKGLEEVLIGLSYLPGAAGAAAKQGADALQAVFDVTAAAAKQNAANVVSAVNNQTSASVALTGALQNASDAATSSVAANNANAAALEKSKEASSDLNKAQLALVQSFGQIAIGNDATRKQMAADEQQYYSGALAKFKAYYDAKIQLAVTEEGFQNAQIAKVRADALKGTGGQAEAVSGASAEVIAESNKQQQLKALRDIGVLNEAQYQAALLASQQKQSQDMLTIATSQATAIAQALGETPEAYQLKLQVQQQQYQQDQQIASQRALAAGADATAIQNATLQREKQFQADRNNLSAAYYTKEAALDKQLGNAWSATLNEMEAAKKKSNSDLAALDVLLHSTQVNALSTTLGNLASLQNSSVKGQFEIGKQAAAAGAVINTAQAAIAALAPPPIGAGPLLGPILAASAIVAGAVQLATIEGQQFNPGGQADQGMDAVPQALAGKSFILSAGERVVQPEANAKLTAFLNQQMGDGTSATPGTASGPNSGTTINITVSPGVTATDAQAATDQIIKALRAASERGQPIISDKGIVYNNK